MVKYVGLDVHKSVIAVAVAEGGERAGGREHGEIANTPAALTKLKSQIDTAPARLTPRNLKKIFVNPFIYYIREIQSTLM